MNRLLPIAALVLSVAALALSAHSGMGGDIQPSPAALAETSPSDLAALRNLERRTAVLEENVNRLILRTSALESRPVLGADGGVVAPAALAKDVAQLRAEVQGLVVGESLGSDAAKEQLKDAVRAAQEEMRQENRQNRASQFAISQVQGSEARIQRWKQFVTDMKLSYNQEQAFMQAVQAEEAARKTIAEAMSTGSKDGRTGMQEIRQLRRQTDEALQKVLDASQRAKYEEVRRQERRDVRGGPMSDGVRFGPSRPMP